MENLRKFAKNEGFRNFVDNLLERPSLAEAAQGLLVGYDRFWLQDLFAKRYRLFWGQIQGGLYTSPRWWKVHYGEDWYDPDYRPKGWSDYNRMRGYPENAAPIYIKLSLRSGKWPYEAAEYPQSWEGHPVIYEYRPPCKAFSNHSPLNPFAGGASVGIKPPINLSGTAGGILRHKQRGSYYLVSCAHVLGPTKTDIYHPAPTDNQNHGYIGTVQFSKLPSPSQANVKCNRVVSAGAVDVDLALAELDTAVPISNAIRLLGPVDRWSPIADITPYQPIVFVGKESDRIEGEVGPLSVWYEIEVDGRLCCFGDLFVITPPRPWYLNMNLAKPGDSGAWICYDLDGVVGWDGMLIGSDGDHAYCCFAENIKRECDKAFSPGLALL